MHKIYVIYCVHDKHYTVLRHCFLEQNWEEIVLQSLSYLVGDEIMLNVQNDEPGHLVMSLRTLIDFRIKSITCGKDEVPDKLVKENSRGTLNARRVFSYYYHYCCGSFII